METHRHEDSLKCNSTSMVRGQLRADEKGVGISRLDAGRSRHAG